jgi:murein DD-endopeptidase MepM/ murein hydrolase activator NlpD
MVSIAPALLPAAALVLGATALSPPSPTSSRATELSGPPRTVVSAPGVESPRQARAAPTGVDLSLPAPSARTLRPGWQWPLRPEPEVLRRFQRPASTWGPGHRGIDLAATPGQEVLAAAAGRVTHVGVVAGRGTVSVLHAGGVRTTYEPVSARVRRGDTVRSGEVIGVVAEKGGSHCSPCLHLGALRGRTYLDPLVLLRRGRVVLLPLTGR